jgi:hypothetical protein
MWVLPGSFTKTAINWNWKSAAQQGSSTVYHSKICIMTRATNNTDKASGDTILNFEDNALLLLLIRGQSSSVAADRIQRNSGTTGHHSGTSVPRPGFAEAMEEIVAATTIPQRRARPSLDPPSRETRRRNLYAMLLEACRLAEACQLVDNDDESEEDL